MALSAGEAAWLEAAMANSEGKQRAAAAQTLQQTATQVLEWAALKRWERDYEFESFRFARDRRHACWLDTDCIFTVSAPLRMFACRTCGRVHFCRGRWEDCIKDLTHEGDYVCAFSGQFIETEASVGTYEGECRLLKMRDEQSINFGGETLEGMHSQGKALATVIKNSRDWMRQEERQKRKRSEADDEQLVLDMAAAADVVVAPKRAKTTRATKIMSDARAHVARAREPDGDASHDDSAPDVYEDDKGGGGGDGNDDDNDDDNMDTAEHQQLAYADDHDALDSGTKSNATAATTKKKTNKKDEADGLGPVPVDNGGGDGAGGGGGGGDHDAYGGTGGGEREVGGQETRLTTSNARLSGVTVTAWHRNTDRLMRQDHNLSALDTSRVSASFLQNVTMELNSYDTMERAVRDFDATYAEELALERQCDTVAEEDAGSSSEEGSTTVSASLTESSPSVPANVERPLNTRRAYKRLLQKVKQGIDRDMRTVVHVLSDDADSMEVKNQRGTEYVNFGMRLFRLLLHVNGENTPARLAHIGIVLMFELLADKFVVIDTVGGREYSILIWNSDAWLARLKDTKMFDLLLIEDARRNKQETRRSAARLYKPQQMQRVNQFREQYALTRAQLTAWVATTRRMLIQVASAAPQAFHAALFSCPIQ